MENSRIKLDRPDIPDENILKHKNFDQAYQGFQNAANAGASGGSGSSGSWFGKSLFKSLNFWGTLGITGVVATVATVAILNLTGNDSNPVAGMDGIEGDTITVPVNTEDYFVRPPLQNTRIAWQSFNIDPSAANELQSSTGSTIYIPGEAFVSSDGSIVQEGNVEIKYREFHNPVDVFLSGIPMTYDTNGVQHTFESAGMLEIRAYQDGEELQVAQDKYIDVDMISYNDRTDFNLYYLDEEQEKWICEGKDKVQQITVQQDAGAVGNDLIISVQNDNSANSSQDMVVDMERAMQQIDMQIEKEKKNLVEPRKAGKSTHLFSVEIDTIERPEFADFSDVIFEVDESQSDFDEAVCDLVWEDASIQRTEKVGLYILALSRMDTSVYMTVYPVFDDSKYEQATKMYQQKMEQLEQKKKDKKKNLQNGMDTGRSVETRRLVDEYLSYARIEPESIRRMRLVRNGVWNMDHPIVPPSSQAFDVDFVDENNDIIAEKDIYLVEKGTNAVYTYPDKLNINLDRNNIIWIVTESGDIGLVRQESINKMDRRENTQLLVVDVYDELDGIRALNKVFETNQQTEKVVDGTLSASDEPITEATETAPAKEDEIQIEQEVSVSAYPNPFVSIINIKTNRETTYNVSLINMSGALVRKTSFTGMQKEWKIGGSIKAGAYILRVESQDLKTVQSIRLVKN